MVVVNIDDKQFKRDVDKLLNLFNDRERKAILRKASRPMAKRMKNSPEFFDYTGEARQSIRAFTSAKTNDYFVGPKKDAFITERSRSDKGNDMFFPFYLYFIEYGFTHVRSGKYIPGTNFIQKAANESKPEVLAIVRKEVAERLRPYGR